MCRKRDKAREEMYQIFCEIIKERRERMVSQHEDDILDYLLHATYKYARMQNTVLYAQSPCYVP